MQPLLDRLPRRARLRQLDGVEAAGQGIGELIGDQRAAGADFAGKACAPDLTRKAEAAPVRIGRKGDRDERKPRQEGCEFGKGDAVGDQHADNLLGLLRVECLGEHLPAHERRRDIADRRSLAAGPAIRGVSVPIKQRHGRSPGRRP